MSNKGIYFKGLEFQSEYYNIKELIKGIPPMLSEETKSEAIRVINRTIANVKMGKVINDDQIKVVIKNMAQDIINNQDALINLVEIKSHDEYTFSHATNVCILLILNCIRRGFRMELIEEIATGGLLHDLGNIRISQDILLKPSRLSHKEFEEIKRHPLEGYAMLNKQGENISEITKLITLQHHERNSGQGYPHGLKEDEISEFASMVMVADVYDALTSDRPYRKKFLPHDAMRLIINQVDSGFSKEAVRLFVEDLSLYPVSSLVMLNTSEVALVIKINRKSVIRPLVKILTNPKRELLEEPMEVNLVEDKTRYILNAVSEEIIQG